MTAVSISACIPTAGRASIARTLLSVRDQWQAGDELMICCDTRAWQPDAAWHGAIETYLPAGVTFSTVHVAADHACFGHCPINAGMAAATGDYIVVQDDDDVWTPGAFDAIRARAQESPGRPLIFRFRTWYGYVVPPEPGTTAHTSVGRIGPLPAGAIGEGYIGGHCLVQPNESGMVGRYSCRYSGDWEFITSSIGAWQDAGVIPVFCPELIAWARPTEREWKRLFGRRAIPA